MKYAFIREHSETHKIIRLCALLEVSPSGYYDWYDRPESNRSRENRKLTERITYHHQQSNAIYGSPKIHEDLIEEGQTCSVNRVARLMNVESMQSMGSDSIDI